MWPAARFAADVTGVHSSSTDDRFYPVQPGLEIKVGDKPVNLPRSLVQLSPDDPVAKYQASARYQRTVRLLRSDNARRQKLDTIVRTVLVITF